MNKVISLDGKPHTTALKCHKSSKRRTFFLRSLHQKDYLLLLFYSQFFSLWFYCTVVFCLRGAVTLDQKASLYTASNCSLYITAGIIESDDKIKSGLRVPGSPLVIPSFCSFHKTSSYIQGRISLEYVKWGSELRGEGGMAYWYPGVITSRYQRVKEDAIGDSRRSLLVTLVGMDSMTHGTQCEKKEQQKDNVCEYATQGQ